jgi:hypothetical protein
LKFIFYIKFLATILCLFYSFNATAQLIETKILPDEIVKIYKTKKGGYVEDHLYTDELGGSSSVILNKGADYKRVELSQKLIELILENIFNKTNEIRTKAGLPVLTRNVRLDEVAQNETLDKFKNAVRFHHTFTPEEFDIPNDTFPNGIAGIGNYSFRCGNNSSVIEIERKTLNQLTRRLKNWKPADVNEISSKIVDELWYGSKEHRQNLLNDYSTTGLAITASNYKFNDFYIDEFGKKHLLKIHNTKNIPLGTLLFVTQIFSIYEEP